MADSVSSTAAFRNRGLAGAFLIASARRDKALCTMIDGRELYFGEFYQKVWWYKITVRNDIMELFGVFYRED